VASVVAEVRDERHLVGGMDIARRQRTCAERREQVEEVSADSAHCCSLCFERSADENDEGSDVSYTAMPALVAGIHVFCAPTKAWMAGPSPAMTTEGIQHDRKTL
jgi:hypothetical protein